MAAQIPNLESDFEENLKLALDKSIDILRSKCIDSKIFKTEFELEVNSIFREFGLEAEQSDYNEIELALDSLNCSIVERFMTFDKFLAINEGVWELPDTIEKAKMLKSIIDRLKENDKIDNLTEELYNCFGDDGLFDILDKMIEDKTYTNEKALEAIKDSINYYLNAYKENPSDYKNVLTPEAENILRSI